MFVSQEAMDFRLLLLSLISAGEPSKEEIKRPTNQIKNICKAPYVAGKSEAHSGRDYAECSRSL